MFLRDEVQNYAKDNFSKILDQMDSVARGRVLGGIAEITVSYTHLTLPTTPYV